MRRFFGLPAVFPERGPIFHGERLKILWLEHKLPGGAPGDPLQQLGGVDCLARFCGMVPCGAVVGARRGIPVAERNKSLPLPLQAHYLPGAVV